MNHNEIITDALIKFDDFLSFLILLPILIICCFILFIGFVIVGLLALPLYLNSKILNLKKQKDVIICWCGHTQPFSEICSRCGRDFRHRPSRQFEQQIGGHSNES